MSQPIPRRHSFLLAGHMRELAERLAASMAARCQGAVFHVRGNEILHNLRFAGCATRQLRDVYILADRISADSQRPSMVLLDRVDLIAMPMSMSPLPLEEECERSTAFDELSGCLDACRLDGLPMSGTVITLATTLTADAVAAAIKRKGRLDRYVRWIVKEADANQSNLRQEGFWTLDLDGKGQTIRTDGPNDVAALDRLATALLATVG